MLSGLASFPFARRYSGNRYYFLFLRVLRCFSSPRALLMTYLIQSWMTGHYSRRVPPFGNPRINACLRLLEAIAADRVLLRRMVPGHPPCALVSLIFSSILF